MSGPYPWEIPGAIQIIGASPVTEKIREITLPGAQIIGGQTPPLEAPGSSIQAIPPWEIPGAIKIFDGPFTVRPLTVIRDVLDFLHYNSYAPYVLGLIFFICLICGINKKLKDHLNMIAIKTLIMMFVLWISIYVLPHIRLYDFLPIVNFDRGGIMLILPILLASIPWIKGKGV
jgi:hypothetical protein